MFTLEFENAQQVWRTTRPEYAALLKAIKAGEPGEKLAGLANNAGITVQAVIALQHLLARATAGKTRQRAAQFQELEKEVNTLNVKVAETDKAMSLAKTRLQEDELESKLYDLVEKRQILQMTLADASVAAGCVSAAKSAGML